MKRYKIDIFEEYCKTVEIEAENRDEALKNLTKKYENGKIELSYIDLCRKYIYGIS